MAQPLARRKLGRSALTVPILGIGCSPFGNRRRTVAEDDVRSAVDAAIAIGASYFDTAPYYGFGLSERRLGDALRAHDGYILSSKVGRLLRPDRSVKCGKARSGFFSPLPFSPVFDYSYDGVMRSYEASLARLGLARIDILLVHDVGEFAHGDAHEERFRELMDGGYRALDELRSHGDIAAVGLGVNEAAVCERALSAADFDCFMLAGRYTLLDPFGAGRLLAACEKKGVGVILGGPYNGGLLASRKERDADLVYDYRAAPPDIVARLRAIERIGDALGVNVAAAALQFSLAHPAVTTVVVGLDRAQRVNATRDLLGAPIPAAFWQALKDERIVPSGCPVPPGAPAVDRLQDKLCAVPRAEITDNNGRNGNNGRMS